MKIDTKSKKVLDFLNEQKINYTLHRHQEVFTVKEANKIHGSMLGAQAKNLFLTNQKKTRFLLISLPGYKLADLKEIANKADSGKLSFASPALLLEKLQLEPGSVSPFGLLNNTSKDVEYFLDSQLAKSEYLNFHPNINNLSLDLLTSDFEQFLNIIGVKLNIL
jgi:Ala-tRNA(Pro) deacylase